MKRHLILLLLALAGIAAAQGVPHNMVSRHTMVNTNLIGAAIGDGLSLTNGVLSSTGGTDVGAVSNIVEGVVADATNGMVRTIDLGNYTGDIVTGGRISAGAIDVQGTSLGTAAYRDASDFATATDEALVYQLITNRLSGVTFDFATVAGLYLAISNIVAAQGGSITNFPAIP